MYKEDIAILVQQFDFCSGNLVSSAGQYIHLLFFSLVSSAGQCFSLLCSESLVSSAGQCFLCKVQKL